MADLPRTNPNDDELRRRNRHQQSAAELPASSPKIGGTRDDNNQIVNYSNTGRVLQRDEGGIPILRPGETNAGATRPAAQDIQKARNWASGVHPTAALQQQPTPWGSGPVPGNNVFSNALNSPKLPASATAGAPSDIHSNANNYLRGAIARSTMRSAEKGMGILPMDALQKQNEEATARLKKLFPQNNSFANTVARAARPPLRWAILRSLSHDS